MLSYQGELQLFRSCVTAILICFEVDIGKLRLLDLVELDEQLSEVQHCQGCLGVNRKLL